MTNNEHISPRSSAIERVPTSIFRFNSTRMTATEDTDNEVEDISPQPLSPRDLHLDERLSPSSGSPKQSPRTRTKIRPVSSVSPLTNDIDRKPAIRISDPRPSKINVQFNLPPPLPDKNENDSDGPTDSPSDRQIDEKISSPETTSTLISFSKTKLLHSSRITPLTNEKDGNRTVKISEYRAPDNTPFEPVSAKPAAKKLHRYLLLTPGTIFSISLFTILSIVVVLIGFGVAIAHRRSYLNGQCSSISYCPRNSSYTVICNITSEDCSCYNPENILIGCFKQRKYHQGCYRSDECSIHYHLQCQSNLYQCQCLDHYFYNGSLCQPMLTYGETCSFFNDTCDTALNLTCRPGNICTCNTNSTFWNGEYCEDYRPVDSPCDPYRIPSGCASTLTCNNLTKTCQCPTSTYFDDDGVCLTYSSYLEPCYDASSCLPNSQLSCLWGLCQCDDSYFHWSSTQFSCIYPKQITYNSNCTYQTNCESDFGLRCINGRCLCESNFYWASGNYCDSQSVYNEQCSTAPCLANTGLICSSNTSICTCPQYYYWDNYVCQYQRTYSSFCLTDSWCRGDLGLRCRSYTCTCSICSTCFWDGVRCRDCPTSWQIVISNGTVQPRVYCYLKVDSYVNWNESVSRCSSAATSYFGPTSHLLYIDDLQELQDVSTFATSVYYDVFIGHSNRYNYSQWFLTNTTLSPTIKWCSGVSGIYSSLKCTRLLIGLNCVTDIVCYGWTSRYICELD